MDFVGNLSIFAAAKEFCKPVKNWQSYSHGYRAAQRQMPPVSIAPSHSTHLMLDVASWIPRILDWMSHTYKCN